ncbi:hypothetical protein Taro_024062 [Colocasia esculenta]|uniref:Uncharacterized protein n=1 Tax=Colocasia esculenta TaxID=4460 RepID=A0A843V6G4_COLES|nr:hypothetical protein [Colocasia esculenta]
MAESPASLSGDSEAYWLASTQPRGQFWHCSTPVRLSFRLDTSRVAEHPAFPSHLRVVPGQRVATLFRRFGRLTPVRVEGVSVPPVRLSRRPWGGRSYRGALIRRVKVLNLTLAPSHLGCRRLKALAEDPFFLSLFPLSSPPPAVLHLPLFPLCVSGEEEGHARVPSIMELA